MSLGTLAFDNKVYNLDLMTAEEFEELLDNIEKEKIKTKKEIRKIIK